MKIRNAILFLFVTVLTFSSCKESEDNPVITMNPTTEKILAEGLNIGSYGKDIPPSCFQKLTGMTLILAMPRVPASGAGHQKFLSRTTIKQSRVTIKQRCV